MLDNYKYNSYRRWESFTTHTNRSFGKNYWKKLSKSRNSLISFGGKLYTSSNPSNLKDKILEKESGMLDAYNNPNYVDIKSFITSLDLAYTHGEEAPSININYSRLIDATGEAYSPQHLTALQNIGPLSIVTNSTTTMKDIAPSKAVQLSDSVKLLSCTTPYIVDSHVVASTPDPIRGEVYLDEEWLVKSGALQANYMFNLTLLPQSKDLIKKGRIEHLLYDGREAIDHIMRPGFIPRNYEEEVQYDLISKILGSELSSWARDFSVKDWTSLRLVLWEEVNPNILKYDNVLDTFSSSGIPNFSDNRFVNTGVEGSLDEVRGLLYLPDTLEEA